MEVLIYHRQAARLAPAHRLDHLHDAAVVAHKRGLGRHDLRHRGGGKGAPLGNHRGGDVSVGNHPDELVFTGHDQGAHVVVGHEADRVLGSGVRGDLHHGGVGNLGDRHGVLLVRGRLNRD